MEINFHFILFEELQEKPGGGEAATRIVIVRESRNSDVALEEGTAGFRPLE